ncbi:helix-turn-helix domain-containing protein [Mesorhizobium sp. CAU 1741]|uniref:TetR/AcrR family transcriptional regulator n=1 Tax=Mesorhizobium sp. CAU 1741 TaxID=3140366 RepID=UPI00325C2AC9
MPKVSKAQVEQSRRSILDAAARLFRLRGFADVSVGEIMREAGLTHGAFYGYFTSKDELIAASLNHALEKDAGRPERSLDSFAASYLSPRHRDNREGGCPFPSLGGEAARSSAETRRVLTRFMKAQIDRLSETAPGSSDQERRQAAIVAWSAMVGAVMLSRISDDPAFSGDLLSETRSSLETPQGA